MTSSAHSPIGHRLRVVFYCGAESQFGLAHLRPILTEPRLEVLGVVLPTSRRWTTFRHTLLGTRAPQSPLQRWKADVQDATERARRYLKGDRLTFHSLTQQAWKACASTGVNVWLEEDVNAPDALDRPQALAPDVLLCAAYPQIFRPELLAVPARAAVNFHPSLLPRYRGAHPIYWVLASGETLTGLTAHYMTHELDAGDILVQLAVPIRETDTYQSLYRRITERVPEIVRRTAAFLCSDQKATPQESGQASVFRQDRELHHRIFWGVQTARQIANLVRAADGKAFFWVGPQRVFVAECTPSPVHASLPNRVSVPPGTVIDTRNGVAVTVIDGVVVMTRWRAESRRGLRFNVGQVIH